MTKTIKAAISDTDTIITDITVKGIRKQLCRLLKIEGPRGLTAITTTGTIIHVELYDDQDYII
jgi:hypothetical protein